MSDVHKDDLSDVGCELREQAVEAKRRHPAAKGNENEPTRHLLADLGNNERDQPVTLAEDLELLRHSGLKNVSASWLEYREPVRAGQK